MRVREASVEDLDELARLFDAYRQFYEQVSDVAAARTFLEKRLQRGESRVFIAEDDSGRGLGFTQLYPMFSSVRLGPVWVLNDLFVDASARRAGVADALMAAAEDFARTGGALGLQLETGEDNLSAQALYRRRGWDLEHGFQHYGLML
jgi:ribosomal protein S18 acetylase RimI-like enzyme